MKKLLPILFSFIAFVSLGQEYGKFKIGEDFNSIFQDLSIGKFNGTVNGVLLFVNTENKEMIFDFQAGAASLILEKDSNEVYDVSYKIYRGYTTSGKSSIQYSTYSAANKLIIMLPNGNFTAGSHDGASDMVINGMNYKYMLEKSHEYLVITTDKDIQMSNFWWLRNKGHSPKEAHELKQEITLKANSSIVFAIKRN